MSQPNMPNGRRGHSPSSSAGSNSTSPSSRHSRIYMPPIAEDEQPAAPPASPTSSSSSSGPLRIPQKSPKRALHASRAPNGVAAAAPPPYNPGGTTHFPQSAFSDSGSSTRGSGVPAGAAGKVAAALGTLEEEDEEMDEKVGGLRGLRERQWFGRRWVRYGLFALAGLLLIGLVVGLAVGLTVGSKKNKSDDTSSQNDEPSSSFPSGSYSLETTLSNPSTTCTSNPLTWRCYPYTPGSNATFFWSIQPSTDESTFSHTTDLTISSSDNPFAPSFSNLTLTQHDRGTSSERLTFSFDMDKTVVPAGAISTDGKSARCTFKGTKFQATLWTRRKDGVEMEDLLDSDGEEGDDNYRAWPGDVEVEMVKDAEDGQPECETVDGDKIDVTAGTGSCTCQYANFEES